MQTGIYCLSKSTFVLAIGLLLFAASCGAPAMKPPVAEQRPKKTVIHGRTLTDPYYWMRDRNDPGVIPYIEAENAYAASAMRHTERLQEKLYKEMKARIKETDLSVPVRDGEYYYYTRTEEGKQYPIHARKKGSLEAAEEIILDQNELAAGKKYFRVGAFEVSPDHKLLAFSTDVSGDEVYTLYVKDLASGNLLPDVVPGTYYSVVWANDNNTLFYNTLDAAKRPFKLFRHHLGGDAGKDQLVYHEIDEAYHVNASKTRSRKYILLSLESQITTEVRAAEADSPMTEFRLIQPREQGVEYSVEHHGDDFYIVTNDNAVNFKLVKAPVSNPGKANWVEVIPHRPAVKLDGVDAFENHLAIHERENGLKKLRIRGFAQGGEHEVSFPEPVYNYFPGPNREFKTSTIRFTYMSLVTPRSVFDYDMKAKTRELKKQDEVLGGYDAGKYQSERLLTTAKDGTKIPISLVYRKGVVRNGRNPTLLYGYGSYGSSSDPTFSSNRLSLLDRGFVFAIAHIRGGGEMGRPWYDSGKLLHKKNTFEDFIACAEHLISEQFTSPEHLAIQGGSAGGLLMGAVTNMRPDLFKAVVAQVPFVDVINTMLDPTIPLTVIEYEEWGNPNEKKLFDYMLSYSPYDNVAPKAYPNILVMSGLNDPRVAYWEPTKWTAKLRATKSDDNRLLLKTNMGAGHGGASGRYDALKEVAFVYAFVLDTMGIN